MNTYRSKKYRIALAAYAVLFLVILVASNFNAIRDVVQTLLHVLRPLTIGLVVAYLINPFFRFFERQLLVRIHPPKLRRTFALILTYLVLFMIIGVLLMLIIPQLVNSITDFVVDADRHWNTTINDVNTLIDQINAMLTENGISGQIERINPSSLYKALKNLFENAKPTYRDVFNFLLSGNLTFIWEMATSVVLLVFEILIGLFISLYLLCTKEKRYAQIMRLRTAMFNDRTNDLITRVCRTADQSFGGFIKGKVLDSCIVGCLVYLALLVLDIPYAVLIAVIVAITDIVPVIGPFIGVIPSAVIILLTDPIKVIPFLICILVVQQIDGNIIAPKILGENTGISSLCVIIAIITMGSLWGFVGMIIGVPLFATILELTNAYLDKRLLQKGFARNDEEHREEPRKNRRGRRAKFEEHAPIGGTGSLSEDELHRLTAYRDASEHRLLTDFTEERLSLYTKAKRDAQTIEEPLENAEEPNAPETVQTADETVAEHI